MNTFYEIIGSPLSEKIGWCLVHSLWQIAIVGLLLKISLDMVGHRSALIRYRLGLLAMFVAIAAPILTWCMLPARQAETLAFQTVVNDIESRGTLEHESPDVGFGQNDDMLPGPLSVEEGSANGSMMPAAPEASEDAVVMPSTVRMPWISWLSCGWLVGMLLFSIRPMLGYSAACGMLRSDRLPVPDCVQRAVIRLSDQLGISCRVAVAYSRLVNVPTLVGVLRPVILLPVSSLTNLSATELDAILLHELAHVRRLDPWANLFQTVVETLLFFSCRKRLTGWCLERLQTKRASRWRASTSGPTRA